MSDLEKTYSREQQRHGRELDVPVTPHAQLAKTLSNQSYRSHRSRNPIDAIRREESHPTRIRIDKEDVDAQLELEKHDEYGERDSPSPESSSTGERGRNEPKRKIIKFEDGDPEQPNNWKQSKKLYALFTAIMTVMNSTIGSSLAAGATGPISERFHVTNEYRLILPTSIYLVGYTCGPLIFGPISESFGRKWAMMVAFAIFTVFSIACAVSPNFASLIIFRLFAGIAGACPIAVVGGICADIYHNPQSRGRSMAFFMAATTFGPIMGPPISGFISVVNWNWAFWFGAIFAGVTWPILLLMPETYAPVILKHRAQKLRKETGDNSITAPIELEKTDIGHIATVVLTRPIRMICFEPLVLFTCLYLSYAYAIFYIFFQSYPLIFTDIYGFNAGEEGLAFLPIGIGAVISAGLYLVWDSILRRAQNSPTPPKWCKSEEMRRLPLACIAGPFFIISLFWAGWSAKKDIHWIVPTLAGIPFGIGYLCLFMAMLNYLVDAYEIFAASAMAAASFSRSSFGAVLPFAAKPMYRTLGVAWACSLLGFLSLAMCAIPFCFMKFGTRIRARSKFCQYLAKRKQEEADAKEREAAGSEDGVEESTVVAGRKTAGVEDAEKQ